MTALPATQTDTTFSVRQGSRLNVSNFGVRSWGRHGQERLKSEPSISDRAWLTVPRAAQHRPAALRTAGSRAGRLHIRCRRGWRCFQGLHDLSVRHEERISAETVKGEIRVEGGKDSCAPARSRVRVRRWGARARRAEFGERRRALGRVQGRDIVTRDQRRHQSRRRIVTGRGLDGERQRRIPRRAAGKAATTSRLTTATLTFAWPRCQRDGVGLDVQRRLSIPPSRA